MKKNYKGFTLMEMLIVVAIIAIIIAISVPVITSQLERTREAADAANIRAQYAEILAEAISDGGDINTDGSRYVDLTQKVALWGNTELGNGLESLFEGHIEGEAGPQPDGRAYVKFENNQAVLVYGEGGASAAPTGFAAMATDFVTNKRWLKNNSTGQLYYGNRNLAEGEITLNAEPYELPAGTTVTFTPTTTMKYSYYLIKPDGTFVDSGWVVTTSSQSKKQFTVDTEGYKLLVVAKLINEDGTRRNATTFTEEEIHSTLDGVSVVTP